MMTGCQSNRILCSNVPHNIDISHAGLATIALPPHELVQIAWQLMGMATLHALEFPLNSICCV